MSSATETSRSTKDFSDEIKRLRNAIDDADAVVVGAGAGLSVSAGFIYSGNRFTENFSDFAQKYGIRGLHKKVCKMRKRNPSMVN